MRLNDLGKPKLFLVGCLAVFALLTYLTNKEEPPVLLHGTVSALQETDGVLRAVAVDTPNERFVVKFGQFWLMKHAPPQLHAKQEVEMKVTSFKGIQSGVTCEFVELVKAGPVPPDADDGQDGHAADATPGVASRSAPKGNAALPVDDLKGSIGIKGM